MLRQVWSLIDTAASLLAAACLLRTLASRVGLSARNPLSQFITSLTDWLVRPVSRIVPASRRLDGPSLACAYLVALAISSLWGYVFAPVVAIPSPALLGVVALVWLIRWSLYLLMGLLVFQAVLSWVRPDSPWAPAVNVLTFPFLRPLRAILPPIGGVDLCPMVLIVVAQLAVSALDELTPRILMVLP